MYDKAKNFKKVTKSISITKNEDTIKQQNIIQKKNKSEELIQEVKLTKEIDLITNNFEFILKNITLINDTIAEYVIKKKINIKEIENKIKAEEDKKEKDILNLKKNIETQIETVLNKANLCMENIKKLGKGKISNAKKEE